jgi:hypothetical protein
MHNCLQKCTRVMSQSIPPLVPVVLGVLSMSVIRAGVIPVNNPSFEVLPAGGLTIPGNLGGSYSESPIPGWVTGPEFIGAQTGQAQLGGPSGIVPNSYINTLPDGPTIAYSNGGTISQTVAATVQVGVTYTLQVDIGARLDTSLAHFDGVADLLINGKQYLAAGVENFGGWATYTATYTGLTADAGQSITIELRSSGDQGDFDNVRLSDNVNGPVAYYFSHLAVGGGYQTTLTYINYSALAVTCVTNFYSDSGSPLSIPFSEGTVSVRTDTLQPGQSIHDSTSANLAAVVEGWAQGSCTGPIQASLLFRLYQAGVPVGEASVNAETAPTTQFATFAQTATGIAYANPSTTQSANITVSVYDAAGARLGSHNIPVGPLAHGSANLGPLLDSKALRDSSRSPQRCPSSACR